MKPWWAAIPNETLLGLLDELSRCRGGKEWNEDMAHLSLKLDFDAREQVTLRGYRTRWGWGAERVKKFIKNSGLELVKVDPENRKSLSVLCRNSNGTKAELNQNSNGTKKIIVLNNLHTTTELNQNSNETQTKLKPVASNKDIEKEEKESEDLPSPPSSKQENHERDQNDRQGQKRKYGEFENVLLTHSEKQKLGKKIGSERAANLLEDLSLYIESSGKNYRSHYATLIKWAKKEEEAIPADHEVVDDDKVAKAELIRASLAREEM